MAELHPTIAELLRTERRMHRPEIQSLSIEAAREQLREDAAAVAGDVDVGNVTTFTMDGPSGELPLRSYWPAETGADDRPYPVLLWFHGGGFALGDLETTDPICRTLANEVGCQVVSVDYRLAPEHPFPAAPNDCYAALEWLAENASAIGGDADRIAVGGASAGGGLAAATALRARDQDGPEICHQLLICPVTTDAEDLPSRRENASGYGLTVEEMEWYGEMYIDDDVHRANPYAYPLKATDNSDLPTATVITAGFDPLRDDGVGYAEHLETAGVPTTHRNYEDVTHSFFALLHQPELDRAWKAVDLAASELRDSFDEPAEER